LLNAEEQEIVRFLAEGYSHKEIAAALRRTMPAIAFDIRIMLVKLDAKNGAHAVAIAFRRGILK